MESIHATILEILSLSKFTKRANLRQQLTAKGFYISDRVMRLTVEHMITDDMLSIGSNERGYFLITSQEDLDGAIHALKSKAEAISIRANCLLRNYKSGKLQEQLTLFA